MSLTTVAPVTTKAARKPKAQLPSDGKTLSKEAKERAERLFTLRIQKKELEEAIKAETSWLLAFMGTAKKAYWGALKVFSIIDASNTSYDGESLAQGWPEAYAAVVRKTPYQQIRG